MSEHTNIAWATSGQPPRSIRGVAIHGTAEDRAALRNDPSARVRELAALAHFDQTKG